MKAASIPRGQGTVVIIDKKAAAFAWWRGGGRKDGAARAGGVETAATLAELVAHGDRWGCMRLREHVAETLESLHLGTKAGVCG